MNKLIRYWPILAVMLVLAPPILVIARIPTGDGWRRRWRWIPLEVPFQGGNVFMNGHSPDGSHPIHYEAQVQRYGIFEVISERGAETDADPSVWLGIIRGK